VHGCVFQTNIARSEDKSST